MEYGPDYVLLIRYLYMAGAAYLIGWSFWKYEEVILKVHTRHSLPLVWTELIAAILISIWPLTVMTGLCLRNK